MTSRRPWLASALVLLPALTSTAADDPYGDPIPAGAKARLGTARMRASTVGTPNVLTPDGKFLVSGGTGNGTAYIDPATGKVVRTVLIERELGTPLGFSADGKRGVATSYQGVFVWDTANGKVAAKVTRPVPGAGTAAALSGDGKRLAVGAAKSFDPKDKDKRPTALVWDVDANKELTAVSPVQNDTVFVTLSSDGKRLATWGNHYDPKAKEPPKPEDDPARLIQFWDAATGKEVAKARLVGGYTPAAVVYSPDSSVVAASSGNGLIYLLDPATGGTRGLLLGRSRLGGKLAFSPDGKTLAAGGEDGYVQRWSLPDGRRLGTTGPAYPNTSSPRGIQFLDTERALVWSPRGSATVVWEVPTGKPISPAGGHAAAVTGAAVAGGGKEIITAAADGGVIRWEAAGGKELGTVALKPPSGPFGPAAVVTSAVTLSPDGTRALANEGFAGGIGVYDLPSGVQLFVIPGDATRQSTGAFTPDGTKVVQVLASYDAKKNPTLVAVWDLAAGKKLGEVEVPGFTTVSASVTPDGKSLVTGGLRSDDKGNPKDFVVTGWELGTGKKLGEFVDQGGFGPAFAAAADNMTAVVYGPRGGPLVADILAGKKLRDLDLGGGRAGGSPVLSPDGKTVVVPLSPNFGPNPTTSVVLVDVATGKMKKQIDGATTGTLSSLSFSPDGNTLVTGSYDTTALVWDVSGK